MHGSLIRCYITKKWRGKGEDYGIFRLEIVQHPTQTFLFFQFLTQSKLSNGKNLDLRIKLPQIRLTLVCYSYTIY